MYKTINKESASTYYDNSSSFPFFLVIASIIDYASMNYITNPETEEDKDRKTNKIAFASHAGKIEVPSRVVS
jgi:hypothetical protein